MKKIIALFIGLLILAAFVSCGAKDAKETKGTDQTAAPATSATEELTESESETEPVDDVSLEERVDAFLEKYMCVTHNKLDIIFNYAGASFTLDNIAAIIKNAAGLPSACTIEIDEASFEIMAKNYQDSGDGGGGTGNGFCWEAPVNVVFTTPSSGESVEREIAFSFRKCLPSAEIYPDGVLGTCPEDGNAEMQAAYSKLKTAEVSEENPAYEGYEGEYTAEAIEEFFRDLTGLTDKDAYGFYAVGFNPEAKGESFYALFCDKNAPDGKFDPVWIETAFK